MNVLCETPQVLIRVQTTPLRFPDGAGVCSSEGGKGLCFMSVIMNLLCCTGTRVVFTFDLTVTSAS